MTDFYSTIQAHGLRPRGIPQPDGRWRRCPTESHPGKKNGAYKLSPDGSIGWFQDWSRDTEPVVWRPDRPTYLPPVDAAALHRQARERAAEMRAATQAARDFYGAGRPLIGGHPYLESHGLGMTGCSGLRLAASGWLIVPMHRAGRLVSVQTIAPDGDKLFWRGAPISGASYTVDRRGATVTILCEGLATGLALYAAVPAARVVVAFNSGNLKRVAEQLPRQGFAAVAADNDHATEERTGKNPGLDAGEAAAAVLGCGVAAPDGIAGTDWCDFRQQRVAERLAKRIRGSHVTESMIRQAVDAEIRAAVMRAARFLAVAG